MYVSNVCDFCGRELPGTNLTNVTVKVATYFDVVYENPEHLPTTWIEGKWCSVVCINKHVDYRVQLAGLQRQAKIDNDEDLVRIVRQKIRDDQAKASWELQQSKELRLVKAMKRLGFSIAESCRLLRVRYCRARATWRTIDS
jgi:hypothetical protein